MAMRETNEPKACCLCGTLVFKGLVYEIRWCDPDTYICELCVDKLDAMQFPEDGIFVDAPPPFERYEPTGG